MKKLPKCALLRGIESIYKTNKLFKWEAIKVLLLQIYIKKASLRKVKPKYK